MKNLYRAFLIVILMNSVLIVASAAQSLGGEWQLAEAKQNGKTVLLARESRPTLIFGAENRISGSGGCNRYSTTYKTAGKDRIEFSVIVSTRMACLKDNLMTQEHTFFGVMEKVERYQIKGDFLIFSDAAKKNVLRFTRPARPKRKGANS